MSKHLRISVPQPCSNRWEEMSYVNDSNRFCSSCEKVITDFTKLSDEQLLAYFKSNTVSCGMFAPHQLNRDIQAQRKQRRPWLATFVLPALMSLTELNAQDKAQNEIVMNHSDSSRREIKLPIDAIPALGDTIIVQGRVLETSDTLYEFPLAYAVLIFKTNDGELYRCASDSAGKFQIKLDSARIEDTVNVEIRYSGYTSYFTSLVLMKDVLLDPVVIRAELHPYDNLPIVGELPIQPITRESRTRHFFWRLFHPRSWFW